MLDPLLPFPSTRRSFAVRLATATLAACVVLIAGCGSGDAPPPAEVATPPVQPVPPAAVPPTITQQPANVTTSPGQSASFTVVATGTAPLTYRWQRNGADITGAIQASYTLPTTVLADSGATFRAIVSNVAGAATSANATLTVNAAAPVLSITPQPISTTVAAGASATFTVGGTCSSGTVLFQWQRSLAGNFSDIAGATGATYSFMTATADNGAQFRAVLSCGGASAAPSSVATLTVTTPSSVSLSLLPVTGLRDAAPIQTTNGIDPSPGGGWDFTAGNAIRHLSADLSTITLVAGALSNGRADGPAASATFSVPLGLVHDNAGTIYVADTVNQTIRRIAADGTVSTLAGSPGNAGFVDGTGSAAQFSNPTAITLGPDGDLYVADDNNGAIRRVTTAGVVSTYAGGTRGFADGLPTAAKFSSLRGLVAAANGDLYIADAGNQRVRRVIRSGNSAASVITFAGNGTFTQPGADGIGIAAGIPSPSAIALRGATLYVLDYTSTIRAIDTTTAAVTTIAGSRTLGPGYADGPAAVAQFNTLSAGIALQPTTGLIVADFYGVKAVDATGYVTTIATGRSPSSATGIGVLAQAPFLFGQTSILTDPSGQVVVSDGQSKTVRRIATSGAVSLVAGLAFSFEGVVNGNGRAAQLNDNGIAIAVAPDGTLYSNVDYGVMRIAPDGTAALLAGTTATFGAMDGPPGVGQINAAAGLAVGPTGDVFVGDAGNAAIRRIDAAGNLTTYAGALGVRGLVDGPRMNARFQLPGKMAFAPDGSLYVIDQSVVSTSSVLRKIAPDGTVSTVPGSTNAFGLAVDPNGTLYIEITQAFNQVLGKLDPVTGTFTRIIGTGPAVVLGNAAPSLGASIGSFYAHGTGQIVVVSDNQFLLVTLP